MSKDSILVGKLKEGIEETVVFLRFLAAYKIPAVVERRRKELLEKLENVQGDTRREKPRKFEESLTKEKCETPPVVKRASKDNAAMKDSLSESSSTVSSPTHRDSKVVNNLVSGWESLHKTAKKEEVQQTPKKWNVELKKTPKPSDFPPTEAGTEAEVDVESEVAEDPLEGSNELKPVSDHHGSTLSIESSGSNPDVSGTPKSKRKNKLGGFFKKRTGRDKSPAPVKKDDEPPPADDEPEVVVPVTAAEPVEEGVKMCGKLEMKVKSRLTTKYVVKEVKLKEDTLYIGDKESIAILGCTVKGNDIGFELVSHSPHKSHTFRVPSDGDATKEQWITAIQTVIDELTPPPVEPEGTESNSADSVPTIEVIEPATPTETSNEKPANDKSSRKRSATLDPKKPMKALPSQELIKGYAHRKKQGLGSRWEKTYCVVTYSAIYFTDLHGNSEYDQMFQLVAGEASFTEKEKGHDKNSKSVIIKMGKKSEQLSFDKKEFSNWWSVLQEAYCFGESLEFNEEEDEIPEVDLIEEDLYEEVVAAPPIPSSPRPGGRPVIAEIAPEDDFMIDEDIYEDTDGFLPQQEASEYQLPVISSAPQLPDRNLGAPQPRSPARNTGPALPSRGDLPKNTGPALPSRGDLPKNTGPTLPSRGDIPSRPPPPRSAAAAKQPAKQPSIEPDDDLYDDVVVKDDIEPEDEDTYDDVVLGGDDGNYDDVVLGGDEDTYDDVVVNEPIQEELYEEMIPGQAGAPQEDYVVMEHGNGEEDEDDGELYVDVEPNPIAVPPSPSPTPKSASPKVKGGTFSRVFAGRKTSTAVTTHNGQLGYKAPKKSKFEDRFVTVEDTTLFVYKTSSDKKHQEKIALSDSALELGSTEIGAGPHALRITKGGKIHHFNCSSQEDLKGWLEVLTKLVKYAPVNLGEQQVFQAIEDHIADNSEQVTFKKGSFIRLISKDNEVIWFGQLGNDARVFDGQTGKFPAEKVMLAEDLYI